MYYLRAHIWLLGWLDFHGFPKITSSRETHVPPLLFATVTPNARSDVYFRAEQAFCSPVTQTARCLPSENHLWKIWQTKNKPEAHSIRSHCRFSGFRSWTNPLNFSAGRGPTLFSANEKFVRCISVRLERLLATELPIHLKDTLPPLIHLQEKAFNSDLTQTRGNSIR